MGLTVAEMEDRQYVVYFLRCPLDGRVRYIGLSSNPANRYSNHFNRQDGYILKRKWIDQLRQVGKKPILQVVTPRMSLLAGKRLETLFIFLHLHAFPGALTNGHRFYPCKHGGVRLAKVAGYRGNRTGEFAETLTP